MPKNNSGKYSAEEQKVIKQIGVRVRQLRTEAGLSQEMLAERVDVHRTYISAIERGQQNISLTVLVRLAGVLEVELKELF